MPETSKYKQSLVALERGVRVPSEEQVEAQDTAAPASYMEPEDLDRLRLLADPAGAGTLQPRT